METVTIMTEEENAGVRALNRQRMADESMAFRKLTALLDAGVVSLSRETGGNRLFELNLSDGSNDPPQPCEDGDLVGAVTLMYSVVLAKVREDLDRSKKVEESLMKAVQGREL